MNRLRVGLSAWLLALAGCASATAPRIYLLTPPAQGTVAERSDPEQITIQLQPVLVPDYLDTSDLLLRSGPYHIQVSPTARWGERLSKGITDTLAAALSARLPHDFISLDRGDDRSSRQILVDVSAFDLWPDGHCVLSASWTVLERNTHNLLCSGREVFEVKAIGHGAVDDTVLVAAMAREVAELADHIAKDVQRPSISSLYPPNEMMSRPLSSIVQ